MSETMSAERLAELRERSELNKIRDPAILRVMLRESQREIARLRAATVSAGRLREALDSIDAVIWDGESPSVTDLEHSAEVAPMNMARCYGQIVAIVRAALSAQEG